MVKSNIKSMRTLKSNRKTTRHKTVKNLSKLPTSKNVTAYGRTTHKSMARSTVRKKPTVVYKYPVDMTLCVLPTSSFSKQETQYEAFQSIFAAIMSANIKNSRNSKMTPYELLCAKYDITLIPSGTAPSGLKKHKRYIFFKPTGVTHYKAIVNGEVRDPYAYYQAKDTQGFCQMFAFLLAIDDTHEFEVVDQSPVVDFTVDKIDYTNFNKLVHNTQTCFTKSLSYIMGDEEVYNKFKEDFDEYSHVKYNKYGINPPGTTLNRYLEDFDKINSNTSMVADYIYDQPIIVKEKRTGKKDEWRIKDLLWYELHP